MVFKRVPYTWFLNAVQLVSVASDLNCHARKSRRRPALRGQHSGCSVWQSIEDGLNCLLPVQRGRLRPPCRPRGGIIRHACHPNGRERKQTFRRGNVKSHWPPPTSHTELNRCRARQWACRIATATGSSLVRWLLVYPIRSTIPRGKRFT